MGLERHGEIESPGRLHRRKPIPPEEALRRILDEARPGDGEIVSLDDALGRRLAEPIRAEISLPPFDRAPLDGFALRSADTAGELPARLRVIGIAAAGQPQPERALEAGEACRIMTGAPMPPGADCMLPFEAVRTEDSPAGALVVVGRRVDPGANVSRAGEELTAGAQVFEPGQRIGPGHAALLAAFGRTRIRVCRRPAAGILATGSELVAAGARPGPGQIRNSNGWMLRGQIARAEASCRDYGIVADRYADCLAAVAEALDEVDVLLTTGGASVGDYDFIPGVLRELGAELMFDKVAMRPGSVTTAARLGDKLIFGLSGNPSACYVGFELFVRPWLTQRAGSRAPELPAARAVLTKRIAKPNPFTRYIRAKAGFAAGGLTVEPLGLDKSAAMLSLAAANAFIVAPAGSRELPEGAEVDVLLLDAVGASDN